VNVVGGELALTALHLAVVKGHAGMCQLLVERGADVNAKRSDNVTPLMLATHWGHIAVAAVLREHGGV